jgi:5-methylcytosine-specific restriction endonuclease McrA
VISRYQETLKENSQKGNTGFWLGKKRGSFSEEARKKRSKIFKSRRLSEEHKRKIGEANRESLKGKKPSEETRMKLSLSHRGERCTFWRGGVTKLYDQIRTSLKYKQWRKEVYHRDNYTCQSCGDNKGHNLNVHHHPKSFSQILRLYNIKTIEEALVCEELWDLRLNQTLCEKCHRKTPTYLNRWEVERLCQ